MSTFNNYIQVTACDNEIYLIAINPNGQGSTELLHYTSGYYQPVTATIYPGAVLETGTYTLAIIGINWGKQANFSVTICANGVVQPALTFNQPQSQGVVWMTNTTLKVTAGQ